MYLPLLLLWVVFPKPEFWPVPLLFLVFINDICLVSENQNVSIKLFAHNIKLYSAITYVFGWNLQSCLNKVLEWFKRRQLDLSPSKCLQLPLVFSKTESNEQVRLNRVLLSQLILILRLILCWTLSLTLITFILIASFSFIIYARPNLRVFIVCMVPFKFLHLLTKSKTSNGD